MARIDGFAFPYPYKIDGEAFRGNLVWTQIFGLGSVTTRIFFEQNKTNPKSSFRSCKINIFKLNQPSKGASIP